MRTWLILAMLFPAGVWAQTDAEKFEALHQAEWEFRLREFPMLATSVGDPRYADRLSGQRLADHQRRREYWDSVLVQLDDIQADRLEVRDQANLAVFRRQINSFVTNHKNGGYLIPFNSDWGFWVSLGRLPDEVPLNNLQDYQNYLARLSQLPKVMDDYIELMREGIRRGMTQPAVILEGRDQSIRAQVVEDAADSVFFRPFLGQAYAGIAGSEDQKAELARKAEKLVGDQLVPAYSRLLAFMTGEYRDAARETLGASSLPNGKSYYADQIRFFTTLDLTAENIHQIGLDEVARIRQEMEQIIRQVEFEGDFAAFLAHLRTDSRFYADTPRQLLMAAAYYSKKMDGKLPELFNTLPRQPYGVEPVPADLAPFFTGGRYVPAPVDSTRPGYYWVNTHNLASRPLYTLPALTLHEAVPGHHLQIALAQEQGDQPPFRRNDYISAFGEGWGLYAEFLGVEAGIYESPYEHFGRLTYEMWRACRLVVDTGLHAFGWERQQAIDYLASNTALSLHEVTTEIDRYISWPGQALSYKLGELKIKALRSRAERALGDVFDLRDFHDVVLSQGSVPLGLLEQAVDRYIAESSSSG
ncbi:MAG: DUF885 domain-containing protein [Xanthomonadales bacterium]|nr:DUF885 domain-containing protein [Xanthomonadales bacterium]